MIWLERQWTSVIGWTERTASEWATPAAAMASFIFDVAVERVAPADRQAQRRPVLAQAGGEVRGCLGGLRRYRARLLPRQLPRAGDGDVARHRRRSRSSPSGRDVGGQVIRLGGDQVAIGSARRYGGEMERSAMEEWPSRFPANDPKTTIYLLVKVGRLDHLETLRRTGRVRMQRLAFYRDIEDATRRDRDDGLTGLYQPDRVTLTFGGHIIDGFAGPIRVSRDDDANHHVFCMHAVTSRRLAAILDAGAPAIDPENFRFGDHALVITNVAAFVERIVTAAKRSGVQPLWAGLVEYIDIETHHGAVGPFRKATKYATESEWRMVVAPSDSDIFWFDLGQSLEDISVLAPVAGLNSALRFSVADEVAV